MSGSEYQICSEALNSAFLFLNTSIECDHRQNALLYVFEAVNIAAPKDIYRNWRLTFYSELK